MQSFSLEAFSFFNRGEFVYCPTFLSGLSVVHIMHLWFGSKDFKAHLSSVLGTQGGHSIGGIFVRLFCLESEFLFLKYFPKEIHMVSFRKARCGNGACGVP